MAEHQKTLKQAKVAAFYARNPGATARDVAAACEVSLRLVSTVREEMVLKGICKPKLRTTKVKPPVQTELPVPPPANTLLDGEQLATLAAGDMTDVEDADPETRKKMLRELRLIAFTANLPDTRVMAMKAWFALKDMASAKDLGPGLPLTEEAAILRLSDMHTAAGFNISFKAITRAFSLSRILHAIEELFSRKEEPDVEASDKQAAAAGGTPGHAEAPGHEGGQAEAEVVRPEHVDGREVS